MKHVLTITAAALLVLAGAAMAEPADAPIHVTVNVDVMPSDEADATRLLIDFVRKARTDPAVSSVTLMQQSGASNHFILETSLPDKAAYDRHVQSAYVVAFRQSLQPHLGSPWDERLSHEIGR